MAEIGGNLRNLTDVNDRDLVFAFQGAGLTAGREGDGRNKQLQSPCPCMAPALNEGTGTQRTKWKMVLELTDTHTYNCRPYVGLVREEK